MYYRPIDYAGKSGGDILQGYVDGLRSQLECVREQRWDSAWRNWSAEACANKTAETIHRDVYLLAEV